MQSSGKKERLDVLVVKQGLAESREKAQALILAGKILTGDKLLEKPGLKIDQDTVLRVRGETDHYVSRGAYKLLGAIQAFKISLEDKICIDVGASTGGFTQVCLENGAKKVYAVDVGHNQMHWKIRSDPKVVCLEGVNMRSPAPGLFPEKCAFACIDASFISLKMLLQPLQPILEAKAQVVALIKPQHEVGKENVGKGGIVSDPTQHKRVQEDLAAYAESIGFKVLGLVKSPISGTTGNIEFLIHLQWDRNG